MMTSHAGNVTVIGNCTMDVSFRLPRFPQPGETLLADLPTRDVGGKGANQAVAAARAGATVTLCASLGSDEDGHEIMARLGDEDIGLDHVSHVTLPTDRSIIYVTPEGENTIVSTHAAALSLSRHDVERALSLLTGADVLLMQGNLPGALTHYCLQRARRQGATTVLNPAPVDATLEGVWPFVEHAILNEVELEQIAGSRDPVAGARTLLDQGVTHVLVTLGAAGAISVSTAGAHRVPAPDVDAIDTTGAGDVLCGVFAAGLASRSSPLTAADLGVRAASLSVTRSGTQAAFPTPDEMRLLGISTALS